MSEILGAYVQSQVFSLEWYVGAFAGIFKLGDLYSDMSFAVQLQKFKDVFPAECYDEDNYYTIPTGEALFEFQLTMDGALGEEVYPVNTTWDIKSGGNVILQGEKYSHGPNATTYETEECLDSSQCYTFSIYGADPESYICLSAGVCSYVAFYDGEVIANSSNWDTTVTMGDCSSPTSSPVSVYPSSSPVSSPVYSPGTPAPSPPSSNRMLQNRRFLNEIGSGTNAPTASPRSCVTTNTETETFCFDAFVVQNFIVVVWFFACVGLVFDMFKFFMYNREWNERVKESDLNDGNKRMGFCERIKILNDKDIEKKKTFKIWARLNLVLEEIPQLATVFVLIVQAAGEKACFNAPGLSASEGSNFGDENYNDQCNEEQQEYADNVVISAYISLAFTCASIFVELIIWLRMKWKKRNAGESDDDESDQSYDLMGPMDLAKYAMIWVGRKTGVLGASPASEEKEHANVKDNSKYDLNENKYEATIEEAVPEKHQQFSMSSKEQITTEEYPDGTTKVTRTIHYPSTSQEMATNTMSPERRSFTMQGSADPVPDCMAALAQASEGACLVTVYAPPGKLGVKLQDLHEKVVVSEVSAQSSLSGKILPGDVMIEVDGVKFEGMLSSEVGSIFSRRSDQMRLITLSRNIPKLTAV